MSNYVQVADKAGDRYLAAVAESQENVLRSLAAWSRWTPQPAFAADFSALREMTTAAFGFFERMLDQQKTFAEKFLGMSQSSVAKPPAAVDATKPRPPRAAKPTARKTSRKRTTSKR